MSVYVSILWKSPYCGPYWDIEEPITWALTLYMRDLSHDPITFQKPPPLKSLHWLLNSCIWILGQIYLICSSMLTWGWKSLCQLYSQWATQDTSCLILSIFILLFGFNFSTYGRVFKVTLHCFNSYLSIINDVTQFYIVDWSFW